MSFPVKVSCKRLAGSYFHAGHARILCDGYKNLGADPLLIKDILHSFGQFEIVIVNPAIIYDAIDCGIINRISFRDSLIVVAAENAHCGILWTEDLNHGQIIRGVRIENPLKTME